MESDRLRGDEELWSSACSPRDDSATSIEIPFSLERFYRGESPGGLLCLKRANYIGYWYVTDITSYYIISYHIISCEV